MTNREKLNQLSDEKLIASLVPLRCPPINPNDKTNRCADRRYTPDNGGCCTCWVDLLGEEAIEES